MRPVPDSELVRAPKGPDKGPRPGPKKAAESEKCSPGIWVPDGVVRMQPAQGFRFRFRV
jgi:hypothetical protein